ncbi:hypothetical protein MUY35_15085 [Aliiroseovarius sp. S1339]|uniref:hypothetical protein n=1 Tax=Aliiroseovarius sp. S1339 TaxID=2936990 RepID=UPI0020C170DD|nr:hypothetical protein [Aliiroseovarius sp. S1339]MCK8465182.1 hypothetical protein [Aliiroseovarius sp. S1339]
MKTSKLINSTTTAAAITLLFAFQSNADGADATELPEVAVINEIQTIRQADLLKLSEPFVVNGDTRFDGWFIKTDRLVFEPGAKLTFSAQALDRRRNFFIIARDIVVRDPANPGTITYEKPPTATASAKPGQGPTGTHGPADGNPGGTGGGGETGVPGATGFASPSITIATLNVPSSGPHVDLTGGTGGQGGQGQKGGDGGNGRKGTPASSSFFDCKAGGGRGGNGGTGGRGGDGGVAGTGGSGGTVTILSSASLLPSLSQKFRVTVSSGQPGSPGAPGIGGRGGAAGPGGQEAKPYCGGGPAGSPGSVGSSGANGQAGSPGTDGDFFVGIVDKNHFPTVFD